MVNTESHSHQTAENNWLWIVNINSQAGKWPSSHKRIIIWSIVHHWLRKIVCFSIKISSGRDADWWQGASLPIGERALGIDPQSLRKRPRRKTLKTYWALCHSLMDKIKVEKKLSRVRKWLNKIQMWFPIVFFFGPTVCSPLQLSYPALQKSWIGEWGWLGGCLLENT